MKNLFILMSLLFFFSANLEAQIEIPVVAHIIRKSNGTLPRVTSSQVDEEIIILNNAYNYIGITFTKCSETFIDSDVLWHQLDLSDETNKLLLNEHTIKNVVNVFFTNLSGLHGKSVFPYKQKGWIAIDYNATGTNNSTVIHEFGHYFGLHHTYSGVESGNPASSSSLTISDAEGINGWKFGDYLIDTPLDPEKRSDYDSNCSYIGNQVDANGEAFHPDGTNYMGKGPGSCRSRFSEGQEKRMLEYIKRYRYHLKCNTVNDNNNSTCANSVLINEFPHNDDFERENIDFFWVQAIEGDDLNWKNSPDTPSSSTGPNAAQSGQTFLYLEASVKYTSSDNTILLSPCYDLTAENYANIEFYYHMYGSRTGSLELEISTDNGTNWENLFYIDGEQHTSETSPWTNQKISLNNYVGNAVQLRFIATGTGSSKSDISIDNITVNASKTPLSVIDNKIVSLKLFPNPTKDFLEINSPIHLLETIKVYTIHGYLVHTEKVNNLNSTIINASHLSKGIYLIKINTSERKEATMKFVKN